MSRWKHALRRRGRERQSAFFKALHECVEQIQPRTAATLAVVLRGSSGSYRDVALIFGAIIAWLGLILILLMPHEIQPWSVPFDVFGLYVLSAWLCSRSRLRRWFTTRKRRRRQARTMAHAAFVEEGLLHAPHDGGILVFWSHLERHVEVIAGLGVLKAVPPHDWNALVFALRRAAHQRHGSAAFIEQLRALGELLTKTMPAHPVEQAVLQLGGER
jgi:uncharacterized membrane protein